MEKIVIKVIADGEELSPIVMREGKEDSIYKDEVVFFSMGHVLNKERTVAPYDYTIRLTRPKTRKELGKNES